MPLVTTKDGTKFGKSEGNALWLDKDKTGSYEMYQYLLNSEDEMVIDYLKRFTFLSKEEIDELERKNKECPEKREAGKALAFEVVKFLHGEDEAIKARETSMKIFSGEISDDMPTVDINVDNKDILSIIVASKLAPSKSEARRLVVQGGISVDEDKIIDPNYVIDKNTVVIKKGKKKIIKVNINI